jgi:hypothetical protein
MLLQFSAVELLRMSGIVSRADITAHLRLRKKVEYHVVFSGVSIYVI